MLNTLATTRTLFIGAFFTAISFFISGCGSTPEKDQADKQAMTDETRTGFMIVCTQDAKQCPDGSYVSRAGHRCEFAACPDTKKTTKTK